MWDPKVAGYRIGERSTARSLSLVLSVVSPHGLLMTEDHPKSFTDGVREIPTEDIRTADKTGVDH